MPQHRIWRHHLQNRLQSLILLLGMSLIVALIGWFIAGYQGILGAAATVMFIIGSHRVAPQMMLRLHRARPITPAQSPGLFGIVQLLAERAKLPTRPQLYYIPSATLNAFTMGSHQHAAIGITDGLLRHLSNRELAGVIAHEISHITHYDTFVMGIADALSRLTKLIAPIGVLFLLVMFPVMVIRDLLGAWLLTALVFFSAPILTTLLQLALSRTREFDADLEAVRLTNDPAGLASALAKIERASRGWFKELWQPRDPLLPSLLRTHPATAQRIKRLSEFHVDTPTEAPLHPTPAILQPQRRNTILVPYFSG